MSKIFISYSRKDESFAHRLATDLDHSGIQIWLDVDNIPAGVNWSTAIQQGLDTCEAMILLLSPDSMESRHVESEWQTYLDEGKPIIPVLWRPTKIHFQLNRVQYIDFYNEDYGPAYTKLCHELRRHKIHVSTVGDDEPPLTLQTNVYAENTAALISEYYWAFASQNWDEAGHILEKLQKADDLPANFDINRVRQNLDETIHLQPDKTNGDSGAVASRLGRWLKRQDSVDIQKYSLAGGHPLLVSLLAEAPGTYYRCLYVSHLAEYGALQIAANSVFVRTGAMFIDSGKTLNPQFFPENLENSVNPHDLLADPIRSAHIVISHVIEGSRLAKRYKLPGYIQAFIAEHHGTMPVLHFYKRAVEAVGDDGYLVDLAEFTYPGPKPKSRESGLLMLADACHAAVWAKPVQTRENIREVVDSVFDFHLRSSQLNDSGLTMGEIDELNKAFRFFLAGVLSVSTKQQVPE